MSPEAGRKAILIDIGGVLVPSLGQALRGPALASQWAGLHAGVGPPPC